MAQSVQARRQHCCTLGFTLIEMMVVIGLIALISLWALPGIKKAYEDFKVNETLDHMSTFVSGFRAHYLIESEFPGDTTPDWINIHPTWCLPSNYFTRNASNGKYYLNIKPYRGTSYDIDSWIASGSKNFHISLYTSACDWWFSRLRKRFRSVVTKSGDGCVTVEDYHEINFGIIFEDSAWRNRYY
ncbi:MAG: type II secretion system protein [bacterium]